MIISYYSSQNKHIQKDLSSKNIVSWEVSTRLGYLPHGSLIIEWENYNGIYPPVNQIINYKEIIAYLKKKHGKAEKLK